jgi:KDO2-lipid IV(A) lauroyltransferase
MRYLAAIPVIGALMLLACLPVDLASAIPGKIARAVGPLMHRHRRADAALKQFLPHLSETERRRVLGVMWENFGRIFGELPHLKRILDDPDRFAFENFSQVMDGIEEGCGIVTITGHFGNWELSPAPSYFLERFQLSFYRTLNSPPLEKYVRRLRERIATGELVAKGSDNLRRGMQALVRGQFIGLMADQRESKGIMVPFMGVEAPTSHAAALLTVRYGSPLLAGIVIRERGVKFRMICRRIAVERTGDRKADILAVTSQVNHMFGEWIRQYPEQWLWTHRRWQ